MVVRTKIGQVCLRRSQSSSLYRSSVPDSSYLQRELRAFILLPEDQRNQHPGLSSLDLRMMIRGGYVELGDQSHQERLQLDDATREPDFSVRRE